MMRVLILFVAVISLTFVQEAAAQSGTSLQFSRVLYVSGGTVPAGKVWKLEKIVNTDTWNPSHVNINGTDVGRILDPNHGLSATGGTTYSLYSASDGQLWLPETTVLTSSGTDLMYSIIEFTVVP